MPEYSVRRQDGVSQEDELRTAEYHRHDEDEVIAAKEFGVRVLAETLGIESDLNDWTFNCGADFVWVHTIVDELPITVHVEDWRRTHQGRVFAWIDPGGHSVAQESWIRTVEELDDAISSNRYYIEHPYVKGPYDNLDLATR